MRRLFGATESWVRNSKRFRLFPNRPFSSNTKPTINTTTNNGKKEDGSLSNYDDTYRQLDNLDFMKAAKILFTDPPKKKEFGLDFHLVQLFFVCMPSLAVYLVAMYARHEMRRMEAELEQKKKAEEEAKAKELELKASEEKDQESNPELSEVKLRLNKLEEAVKEIVVESKKQSVSTIAKNQEDLIENKFPAKAVERESGKGSEESSTADSKHISENITPGSGHGKASELAQVTDNSQHNQEKENGFPSQDAKK